MLAALALTVNVATPTPTPSSAESFYAAALQRMQQTRQPALVQYVADISVPNGVVLAGRQPSGTLVLRIGPGDAGPNHATFLLRVGDAQHTYVVQFDGNELAHARLPMLNAMWQGIDDWMRYGFFGYPDAESPPSPASPTPDTGNLDVVAAMSSFAAAYYRASDGPDEACANSDPGHVINLAPLGDPYAHPLRAVTIDRRDGLFCTVHFIAPFGRFATAYVTLHLGDVGGYYFVLSEVVDMFRPGAGQRLDQHLAATITFSHFRPASP